MKPEDKAKFQRALDALTYINGDEDEIINAMAALRQLVEQPEPVQEPDRVRECAKRLVEHADFKLGGALSADSKAKDIPSNAISNVKARHLAALRDALEATPPAQPAAWDYDALHGAWLSIGADLAGLKWEDFEAKMREENGGA
jgi:hypothetical protein